MARTTVQINLRLKPELRDELQAAAGRNNSTVTKEITERLQASLDHELLFDPQFVSPKTQGLIQLLASVMHTVGPVAGISSTHTAEGARSWFDDPFAYEQVFKAIALTLEALRPKRPQDYREPKGATPDLQAMYSAIGSGLAMQVMREVAGLEAPSGTSAKRAPILRRELGDLVERIQERVQNVSVESAAARAPAPAPRPRRHD
jgi:hypothetical protein